MNKWLQVELTLEMWQSLSRKAIDMGMTRSAWVKELLTREFTCRKPVVGPGAERMPSQGGSTPPPASKLVIEPKATLKTVTKGQREDPKCKHWFVPGQRECKKCGWVPPL